MNSLSMILRALLLGSVAGMDPDETAMLQSLGVEESSPALDSTMRGAMIEVDGTVVDTGLDLLEEGSYKDLGDGVSYTDLGDGVCELKGCSARGLSVKLCTPTMMPPRGVWSDKKCAAACNHLGEGCAGYSHSSSSPCIIWTSGYLEASKRQAPAFGYKCKAKVGWKARPAYPKELKNGYKLRSKWSDGKASDCLNLGCSDTVGTGTGNEAGLASCKGMCDTLGPECNLINYVPTGADGTSGEGRCCLRSCANMSDLQLTDHWKGWDVYVKLTYALKSPWTDGKSSDCMNLGCNHVGDGLALGLKRCKANCDTLGDRCNLINFVPAGADGQSGEGRCCTRFCGNSSDLKLTDKWKGWDVYVKNTGEAA